jgi:hypothetical protein
MEDLIQRYESIKRAAILSLQQTESLDGLIQSVLDRVVIETLHKYQQKINVGIQDSVNDLLDNFKQKTAQAIFDVSHTWRVANREPVLFPRGCRFCSVRGESTIFVIEQDPQIRSLSFQKGMLGESYQYNADRERVSLALPYVIFIVHFRNNSFAGLYCGWRKQPLASLEDMLSRPVLPNIHDNLNVCLGSGFSVQQDSMSEMATEAIDSFWNSTFSNDMSSAWWSKFRVHPEMVTAKTWARQSIMDSTFILHTNFLESRSLQHMLNLLVMHEQEPDENAFRHKLAEGIDGCAERLFASILRYFKKVKFERHHPQDITDSFRAILQQAVEELVDVTLALDAEVQRLANDIKPKAPVLPTKVGKYWSPYNINIS